MNLKPIHWKNPDQKNDLCYIKESLVVVTLESYTIIVLLIFLTCFYLYIFHLIWIF